MKNKRLRSAILALAVLSSVSTDGSAGANPIIIGAATGVKGAVLLAIWHSQRDKERLRKWLARQLGITTLDPVPDPLPA